MSTNPEYKKNYVRQVNNELACMGCMFWSIRNKACEAPSNAPTCHEVTTNTRYIFIPVEK